MSYKAGQTVGPEESDLGAPVPVCEEHVYWWNGEYDDNCKLPERHEGDHFDGLSWFNNDNECTDDEHFNQAQS